MGTEDTTIIEHGNKHYRISPAGMVEVFIPRYQQRLSHWRLLDYDGRRATQIRRIRAKLKGQIDEYQ